MGQRTQIYLRYNGKLVFANYYQWNFGERMISRARWGKERQICKYVHAQKAVKTPRKAFKAVLRHVSGEKTSGSMKGEQNMTKQEYMYRHGLTLRPITREDEAFMRTDAQRRADYILTDGLREWFSCGTYRELIEFVRWGKKGVSI